MAAGVDAALRWCDMRTETSLRRGKYLLTCFIVTYYYLLTYSRPGKSRITLFWQDTLFLVLAP